MSSKGQVRPALRVCAVRDGKVCDEHVLKPGMACAVRDGVLVPVPIGATDALASVSEAGCRILPNHGDQGRIKTRGQIHDLRDLQQNPLVTRIHGRTEVELVAGDRGRLQVQGVGVLFQVMGANTAARSSTSAGFRPRLFDDDDPVFFSFIGLFAAMGMAAAVLVTLAPEPPEQTFVQAVSEPFVLRMKQQQPEPPAPEPPAPPTPKIAEVDEIVPPPWKPAEPEAPRDEAALKSGVRKIVVPKFVLGRGLVGAAGARPLQDEYLPGLPNTELAPTDGPRKNWTPGVPEGFGPQDGPQMPDGPMTSAPDDPVQHPIFRAEPPPDDGTTEPAATSNIHAMVNAQSGRLVACYEGYLRYNPGSRARIEMSWTVRDGRVSSSEALQDTTGNSEFVQCMERKLRGFRFKDVDDGVYGPWPFTFRPGS